MDVIAEIEGVKQIYGVFGRFDLIAIVDTTTLEEINQVITEDIRAIKTAKETVTFIASF